jgi:ribose transport system permease protein
VPSSDVSLSPAVADERADQAPGAPVARPLAAARRWRSIARMRELGILAAAVLMFVLLSLLTNKFLTSSNILNVARSISLLAIIACGMTFLFVAGELDLSVGSNYAVSAVLFAFLVASAHVSPILALPLTVLAGGLVGLVNGLLTTKIGIPSFIVTLGTLSLLRGVALLGAGGWPIPVNDTSIWSNLLGGNILMANNTLSLIGTTLTVPASAVQLLVPVHILWMAVVLIVGGVVLAYSVYGYHVYATGGNRQAARLTGIDTDWVKIRAFMLTGALVGLAASLLVTWLHTANPNTGLGLELDVIAAVIIGGTNLFGGAGSIFGTFLGASITGMITNGLVLLGASAYVEPVVKGLIIISAVGLDIAIRKRQR